MCNKRLTKTFLWARNHILCHIQQEETFSTYPKSIHINRKYTRKMGNRLRKRLQKTLNKRFSAQIVWQIQEKAVFLKL